MSAGDRLREMLGRAGHSFASFARAVDFKGASSVQTYLRPEREFIPFDKVERFAGALIGKGTPPITREEVYALAGINPVLPHPGDRLRLGRAKETLYGEIQLAPDTVNLGYGQRDLPVMGEPQGAEDGYFFGEGETVLALTLRPAELLNVRGAYAVYVHGDSMIPRFRPGELLYIDPIRPPAPGDDVVIRLVDGSGYVKEFARRTPKALICRQHNPQKEVEYPADKVVGVHLIVSMSRVRV